MKKLKISSIQLIFLGMFIGLIVGWIWPEIGVNAKPLSTIFLRLIKSIIAPLIFSTLIIGIAGHGNIKQVGRIGFKSIIYFEVVTTFALFIGLFFVNYFKPGVGVHLSGGDMGGISAKQQSITDVLTHIFPQSVVYAASEGELLQLVVFTLIFSLALLMVAEEKRKPILTFFDSLAETMFKFTNIVMKFAPIGVGAAIAVTVGHRGLEVLYNLGLMILTFYVALTFFVVFVLIGVMLIFKIPIKKFFTTVKEPALIAFSTTSSEAALPKALEVMEKFGVSRKIVSFVLPLGYSFNLDGSTLYLSLASVFVAQAAGIDLTFTQQALMMLTLMLTSKGVAGVPRASLIILAGTLATFGLPLEGVAVILGIDEIMDMGRTMINVVGNCLATVVVAKWEGETFNHA